MNRNLEYVELPAPKRSAFDMSYNNRLTTNFGRLTPVFAQEVLPNDEWEVKDNFLVRMAPMTNPIFSHINAEIQYFFVPNRILWKNWQDFITGSNDAGGSPQLSTGNSNMQVPYFTANELNAIIMEIRGGQGTLPDYLGVPQLNTNSSAATYASTEKINALPFLAYQRIYDDYYKNKPTSPTDFDYTYRNVIEGTGGDVVSALGSIEALTTLRYRAYDQDRFNTALPWAQRGVEVKIPLGFGSFEPEDDGGSGIYFSTNARVGSNSIGLAIEGTSNDLIPLATIRDLRNASRLQAWLERNALGGGRYIEQIASHFGIRPADARLQRSEYLGQVKAPVVVSDVEGTTNNADTKVGQLAGKGISYGNGFVFREHFDEHGWIIGIMSVMPDVAYFQGLHKSLTRLNTLDYAFPEFAEVGMQPIYKKEVFWQNNISGASSDNAVFGYEDRYAEYKSNTNQLHGAFANVWRNNGMPNYVLARFYTTAPSLGTNFITQINKSNLFNPFAAEFADDLWVDIYHDAKAVRCLPDNMVPILY